MYLYALPLILSPIAFTASEALAIQFANHAMMVSAGSIRSGQRKDF